MSEEAAGTWLPFGLDADDEAGYSALREDVPEWLSPSLWSWIKTEMSTYGGQFNRESARACERALRTTINYDGYVLDNGVYALRTAFGESSLDTWKLVDFLLSISQVDGGYIPELELDQMLTQSGSAWRVGLRRGSTGLVRRVPEGVADAAERAFQYGDAGRRLAKAWEAIYGLSPNPSNGYSLAVKAVEDAVMPVVSPNDQTGHLGKAIGSIANGTWTLPHLREDTRAPSHDVLVSMMRLLWVGQHDRHGGPSSVGVPEVTQQEAESAIALAVTLVDWFSTGKVQP
ncbi:hypothetical protein SAMN04489765_3114 [Tsukamurella pulmonis]|uniref:Abortive infection C-terminus n=1 Tax=Tsukamurella pulmonis TaxID=47312 RepID=A0A1H1G5C6_9ACTN|nr:hypothetical protein [Tsukamurella pulmonis]SDR08279.1 hypothetical protein SAMN04489765_3114 [Tsukamurella pulmonis]SUP17863.1 Uncharacterised protein [Tsukamurella pulmonis]